MTPWQVMDNIDGVGGNKLFPLYNQQGQNKMTKALELLENATQQNENLDNIYDYVFASFISNEAQQLANEKRIVSAMKHYENL